MYRVASAGRWTALNSSPLLPWTVSTRTPWYTGPSLMDYLLSLRAGFDAVVPVIDDQPQALHAVYHRRCAEPIKQLIDRNELRITGLFDRIRVRLVGEAAIRAIDPELRSFTNLNTPEELARARRNVGNP